MMKLYEGLFVFSAESGPDARKEELSKVEKLFAKHGGKVTEQVEWGKRTMGYAVEKKSREGFVVILRLELEASKVDELTKALNLESYLLKFMITSVTEKTLKGKPLDSFKKVEVKKTEEVGASS